MSYRAMPGRSRTRGSTSRGTAMSISTSGRSPRSRRISSSSSRPTIWWGEAVQHTTMSACASSAGRSSKRTAEPPKRWARPMARS